MPKKKRPVQLSVTRATKKGKKEFETYAASVEGVEKVQQVFPEQDEFYRWYVINVEPDKADDAIATLKASPLVESVERASKRRLV